MVSPISRGSYANWRCWRCPLIRAHPSCARYSLRNSHPGPYAALQGFSKFHLESGQDNTELPRHRRRGDTTQRIIKYSESRRVRFTFTEFAEFARNRAEITLIWMVTFSSKEFADLWRENAPIFINVLIDFASEREIQWLGCGIKYLGFFFKYRGSKLSFHYSCRCVLVLFFNPIVVEFIAYLLNQILQTLIASMTHVQWLADILTTMVKFTYA